MSRFVQTVPSMLRSASVMTSAPVRGYASEAFVKAPIQVFGLGGRYAHALFSASSKKGNLDTVEAEMANISKLAETNKQFGEFLHNPSLQRSAKATAIQEIMKKGKFSETTSNFMQTLAENNRLGQTEKVVDAFEQIMRAHRGEVKCTVTSARELDATNLKNLKTALAKFMKPNEKLVLETRVDKSIIGGMIVDIGNDRSVDMSISSRVKKIAASLRESL